MFNCKIQNIFYNNQFAEIIQWFFNVKKFRTDYLLLFFLSTLEFNVFMEQNKPEKIKYFRKILNSI